MLDFHIINQHIQEMTYAYFDKCCKEHQIAINQHDLNIILRIIQNNPYSLINEEYNPILLNEIKRETDINTLDKIKPMIVEKYLIALLL